MLHLILQKYKDTFNTIESSANPKTQLFAIIDFFREIESQDFRHLVEKFLPDFILPILNIYKHSSVSFIDPEIIVVSRFLFNRALSISNEETVKDEISSIINELNIRLLLAYYYLGEAENGKAALEEILRKNPVSESSIDLTEDVKEKQKGKVRTTSSALSDPRIFKVSIIFNILHRINYELNRVNSYYSDSVNVLLVESDLLGNENHKYGLVMELLCSLEKTNKVKDEFLYLDNIVDVHNDQLDSIKEEFIIMFRIYFKYSINIPSV